jgi:hypothetical protein
MMSESAANFQFKGPIGLLVSFTLPEAPEVVLPRHILHSA